MIPPFYKCSKCEKTGVKLWRQYQILADQIELLCGACAELDQGKKIDLSLLVRLAVPTLDDQNSWWGYTSVPPEGCDWWDALPLQLEGEWPTKKGIARWMTYHEGMDLVCGARGYSAFLNPSHELLRVDFYSKPPRVLVLISTEKMKRRDLAAIESMLRDHASRLGPASTPEFAREGIERIANLLRTWQK